jgi:23S rRNA (pseudouridine1915-N3)-methyltransferase
VKILVVAVGKVKDRPLRAMVDEYVARTKRYVSIDEIELDDLPAPKLAAAMKKAAGAAHTIALDMDGRALDSMAFAREVERLGATGKGDIAFLIGGKEGLPDSLQREASAVWSLSKMTFPHRLARLMLVEQIYRAMTILRGEPYGL